jgi:hypothetical protein
LGLAEAIAVKGSKITAQPDQRREEAAARDRK